jgi:hypothetical protein
MQFTAEFRYKDDMYVLEHSADDLTEEKLALQNFQVRKSSQPVTRTKKM